MNKISLIALPGAEANKETLL